MNAVTGDLYANTYAQTVAVFCPLPESEEMRRLRYRLLASRDMASRALTLREARTREVEELHRIALHVASTNAFRPFEQSDLEEAARVCVRLMQAGRIIDRLECGPREDEE